MVDVDVEFVLDTEEGVEAEFVVEPDVTYTADIIMASFSGDHRQLVNRELPEQHPISAITGLTEELEGKQDNLTAGENIQIENNVISATDTTYTAGDGISIENGVISNTRISAEWGNITGDIDDQLDLKEELVGLAGQISENHEEIGNIGQTIGTYGDIVTHDVDEFATAAQGGKADTALQPGDNISELVNNTGYITGISSSDVTTALGYTPYNATNPDGFISGVAWGDVTGTLSEQTDLQNALDVKQDELTAGNGIDITSDTISVADPTLVNNGTGTKALAVGKTSQSTAEGGVAVGYGARANSTYGTAVGYESRANNTNTTAIGKQATASNARAIAIGSGAEANADDAIAIKGINNTANTFQVYTYNMLDMSTGLIPDARISSNIARTTDLPTNYVTTDTAQSISGQKSFTQPLVVADNNGIGSGTTVSNKVILQRTTTGEVYVSNSQDKVRLRGVETRPQYNGNDLALYSDVTAIDELIPNQASTSNQLADKAFVNSSVQTATANFRGNWSDWASVPTVASDYPVDYAGNKTPTVNDYLIVQDASDYTLDTLDGTWRFKYSGEWSTDGKSGWLPEYQVNETPLTQAQLDAINSGITAADVTTIGTALQPNDNVSELVNDAGYIKSVNSNSVSITTNGSFSVTCDGTTAFSYDYGTGNVGFLDEKLRIYYNDVEYEITFAADDNDINFTTGSGYKLLYNDNEVATVSQIPTVNNATLTIQKNGTDVQTFTANASSDVTANITVPTDTGDLTNNAGFITSSDISNMVTTDTAQNITGTKTFVGQKKIGFKQSSSSDKLGFTLYNNGGTEKGYLYMTRSQVCFVVQRSKYLWLFILEEILCLRE